MEPNNPLGWLSRWASEDPDRTAVVTSGGEVSYHQLYDMVQVRASVLRSVVAPGFVAPVQVRLDLPSVVEVFSIAAAGAVPLPHDGTAEWSPVDASDDHICVGTSGSSGTSRIVRISGSNIAAAVAASRKRLDTDETDRWLLCLPIHHVAGLSVLWRSFEAGGSVALAPFDPNLAAFIEMVRPTIASMVPTMLHRLLLTRPDVVAGIPRTLVGGAHLSGVLAAKAEEEGVGLLATYGATETTSQVATGVPDPEMPSLVGEPLSGFRVSIRHPDGSLTPSGEVGRIAIDGPAVSPGYLGDVPRAGAWVSGDMGSMDSAGRLHVHGRFDDMVVTGGENVFLGVVADAVRSCEGVDDAFACGVPDVEWGTAVVMVYSGPRSSAAIESEIRDQLPAPAIPRRWVKVNELPQLSNGKHDRRAIHQIAKSG